MRAGLDDAGLLGRDPHPPVSFAVGVIEPDVGNDSNPAVGDVGRVETAEHADLDHRDVDLLLGEPGVGRTGQDLERHQPVTEHMLGSLHRGEQHRQRAVVDVHVVDPEPLVVLGEMRAGVGADAHALGHQQAGDDPRRGTLAVGAGDVDDRQRRLRIAEQLDEAAHPVEGEVDIAGAAGSRGPGAVVDVALDVLDCCADLHHEKLVGRVSRVCGSARAGNRTGP